MARISAVLRGRIVLGGLLVSLGAVLFCLTLVGAVRTSASDAPSTGNASTFGVPAGTLAPDGGGSDNLPSRHGHDDDDTVCVCHIPPGNPQNAHTICVDRNAVCAHILHGDELGECEQSETCGGDAGRTCPAGEFCSVPDGQCGGEGECTATPPACPASRIPVCGCDDRTYSNSCFAEVAGVTVAHEGACATPQACGGDEGDSCGADRFCKRPEGQCSADAEGICARKPTTCITILDPVCGCDGTTYDNACQANEAGVNVEHAGACETEQACGGTAGDTCDDDQFCKLPEGVCSEDAEGLCAPKPAICPGLIDPVCGCDGTTYDNACIADGAGVSVDHVGACEDATRACGGASGGTCGPIEFCKRPNGECSEDAEGTCRRRPLFCPPVLDPVCGCDGETYDNGCQAAFVGVSVEHTGACSSGPQVCGGTSGGTCGANQYCKRPDGQCSESAEGVCTDVPGPCQPTVNPVCGCNGATYDNACAAASAGVSVDHAGACESSTEACGGASGGTCGPLQFCKRPNGACSEAAEGVCRHRPLFCPPVLDPVCGCDGETYDNGCQAAFIGVTVNHPGACEVGTQVCGGTSGGTCGATQYCKRPDGQCSESTEGVCTDTPGACSTIFNPVCGCNGATYDNACAAASAGVSVHHAGACESSTEACGGASGGTCGPLQFCKRPNGACSEAAEGVCRHRPLFCPPVLDPVCGCDGETYDNGCQAAFIGVTVDHAGACESSTQVCGGASGGTCGANQYCKRPDGQCSESTEGVCTDTPGACSTILNPVCGCNGATYDNACAAASAGVSVDHAGACESSTEVCGGASGGTCGPLQFCKRPDGACSEAAEGVCRHRPLFCPPVLDPVCGCDGETYDNGCQAAFIGVTVNHAGACEVGTQVCGGTSGGTCGANQYCKRPDGQCSESTEGVCTDTPGACPTILDPVCGCNGATYDNACAAASAGVSVDHAGACESSTEVCGGTSGGTCGPLQFCKRPNGACSEAAEGVCRHRPLFCPPVLDPVCGCDGETYDNGCQAAFIGVTVNHAGACETETRACGGTSGGTCGPLEYCNPPDGECSANAEGLCRHRPLLCPPVSDPVCGCDGETYDNACQAAFLGVNVSHAGVCTVRSAPRACSGNGTCGANQYCRRPLRVCNTFIPGVCTERPATCPTNYDPVCGCDGTTYDNACRAGLAGVSVSQSGACGDRRAGGRRPGN